MTTDTAVRVTRLVSQEKSKKDPRCSSGQTLLTLDSVPLEQIPYDDYPEIRINEHERTEMPFRYVKDANGQPIMPPVCAVFLPVFLATRTGLTG